MRTEIEDKQLFVNLLREMSEANRENVEYPELIMLNLFGLYNSDEPEKSWLHRLVSEPEIARETLSTLVETGTFPPQLATVAWQRAQYKILKRQQKAARTQYVWRGVKVFTKGLALLGLSGEESTAKEYFLDIIWTYGLWGLIDRAAADSEERKIAYAVALGQSLQRAFIIPDDRGSLSPAIIAKLTLGHANPSKETLEIIEYWQKIIEALLDSGVMPQAIFKVLKRHMLHTPFRWSVTTANESIIQNIEKDLGTLKAEISNGPRWDSKEAIEQRRKRRQKLARQVLQKTG